MPLNRIWSFATGAALLSALFACGVTGVEGGAFVGTWEATEYQFSTEPPLPRTEDAIVTHNLSFTIEISEGDRFARTYSMPGVPDSVDFGEIQVNLDTLEFALDNTPSDRYIYSLSGDLLTLEKWVNHTFATGHFASAKLRIELARRR